MTIYVYMALAALAGYLIGSINLSIIISRLKGSDIRKMGSGNAGSTNVLRTMGPAFAAVVFLFDILKGLVPTLILMLTKNFEAAYVYALFAIVGHCFPLYFGFKGGKGVATAIGVLFAIDPVVALLVLIEFIIILLLFRFVSLASIVAALNLIAFTYFLHGFGLLLAVVFLAAVLVIAKHAPNVVRIREGSEKAIFGKGKK